MLERFLTLEQRRRRLSSKTPPGPLADYLHGHFVDPTTAIDQVEFVVLDVETTGLNCVRDDIVSIGFTLIQDMSVLLGSSRYFVVRPYQSIPVCNAVIHKIFDDESSRGVHLEQALSALLQVLSGRVLVAHHARIDCGFIGEACRRVFQGELIVPCVDTCAMEIDQLRRRGCVFDPADLRLGVLRKRYGLPRYHAHHALTDAIATAELFLAQIAHRTQDQSVKLTELYDSRVI